MAELMVLEPNKTNLEYASIIGVDPKTLYKWKKCPEFQEYVHELCQQHKAQQSKEASHQFRPVYWRYSYGERIC